MKKRLQEYAPIAEIISAVAIVLSLKKSGNVATITAKRADSQY